MRIDLPCCGFHYCKYQFDGNCTNREKYQKCEYQYYTTKVNNYVGKWIYHSDWATDGECAYECNWCGRTYDYPTNYCGYCGAKMEGVSK